MTSPGARVDALRAAGDRDALVALLAEQSAVYAELGSSEAERLRGYAMASFEAIGLPPGALPSVIEALATAYDAYPLAAAARALRVAAAPPDDASTLLLRAVDRVSRRDEIVSFDRFDTYRHDPASGPPVTALMELFRALGWLGARARSALPDLEAMQESSRFSAAVRAEIAAAIAAISSARAAGPRSCCGMPQAAQSASAGSEELDSVEVQDQDGKVASFAEAYQGRPTVLTFFYTRCMNPEKCLLTIAKLGRLQQRLAVEGLASEVNLAAVTYDPAFDLPRRLRAYGAQLGLAFDARTRLWRTTGPFEPLRNALDLGVGYGPATVNQHRIELFVLDAHGRVAEAITRRLWEVDEVLDALRGQLGREAPPA